MHNSSDTPRRILDIAERLVQTCGYNGFSYADIAAELKVTKASLHYHFRGKADLGARLIERYEHNFLPELAGIDEREKDARGKLRRYAAIYGEVLRDGRMCLCGMLAAEYATLPEAMRIRPRHYFDENERWLARGHRRHGIQRRLLGVPQRVPARAGLQHRDVEGVPVPA